jgi:hypothetical protein
MNKNDRGVSMSKPMVNRAWWSCAVLLAALAPGKTRAQTPDNSTDSTPVCTRTGPIHRLFHHSAHTLQDKFVGYPDTFKEPPLGSFVNEQFAVQVAKADPHRFTLYRTDFLPGTNQFSPIGASRFNIMLPRISSWPGPITVEWTPDLPGLAESRRLAVLATLQRLGRPIVAERVTIGPSPYPGMMGVEASNNYTNTIMRTQNAATTFALPPSESSASGVR